MSPPSQHLSASTEQELSANVAHFAAIPWCAKLINEPGWTPVVTRCREPKASTEDAFMSTALQTPGTLARHATICRAPSIPLPANFAAQTSKDTITIPAARTFWQLGSDVNGYPHIAHGGLLATLLDEQMGILLVINSEFGKTADKATAFVTDMTVYMNVRYKAPVKTPGVVMAVAECTKRERRKTFIHAAVVDEAGVECVVAEGMFIEVPETRL